MISQDITRLSADAFRAAMRHLASGVSLITTRRHDGVVQGMLATAVASVTADPPTLLICINQNATMHDDLVASGNFCVNFLGRQHIELAERFLSREGRTSRFQAGHWIALHSGAPVLGDSLSALDCSLEKVVEYGSHTVLFGAVQAVRTSPDGGAAPLLYYNAHYGQWAGL